MTNALVISRPCHLPASRQTAERRRQHAHVLKQTAIRLHYIHIDGVHHFLADLEALLHTVKTRLLGYVFSYVAKRTGGTAPLTAEKRRASILPRVAAEHRATAPRLSIAWSGSLARDFKAGEINKYGARQIAGLMPVVLCEGEAGFQGSYMESENGVRSQRHASMQGPGMLAISEPSRGVAKPGTPLELKTSLVKLSGSCGDERIGWRVRQRPAHQELPSRLDEAEFSYYASTASPLRPTTPRQLLSSLRTPHAYDPTTPKTCSRTDARCACTQNTLAGQP
ncbi:hypothetical protein CC86DRAFT_459473 [Ophiobolus disseminans]|uniref:Uncharacterized protein n=1 Tax=Ophiobolus disseminans TaxID=1469910 RepID=A0A6A6ZJQ7_9PLEO|nr:hypothetical protein CC86DRAFT_459473 [Ophiobolus disseminans]